MTRLLAALAALLLPRSPTDSESADPALTQTVESDEQVAAPGTRVELDSGHVDLGPHLVDGQWEFMARDDTEPTPVWRELDDVVFRVNDEGKLPAPTGEEYSFIGATGDVWVVPQQEIPQVVWLGWNTQHPPVVETINASVSLIFEGHEGPGNVSVSVQSGNFAGPQLLWASDDGTARSATVDLNTHTHANWVFTEPGIHKIRLTAQGTDKEGTLHSDTAILTFAVGTDTDASGALDAPEPEETPTAVDQETIEVTNSEQSQGVPMGTILIVALAILAAGGLALAWQLTKQRSTRETALTDATTGEDR